jgi:hypothetical protein
MSQEMGKEEVSCEVIDKEGFIWKCKYKDKVIYPIAAYYGYTCIPPVDVYGYFKDDIKKMVNIPLIKYGYTHVMELYDLFTGRIYFILLSKNDQSKYNIESKIGDVRWALENSLGAIFSYTKVEVGMDKISFKPIDIDVFKNKIVREGDPFFYVHSGSVYNDRGVVGDLSTFEAIRIVLAPPEKEERFRLIRDFFSIPI